MWLSISSSGLVNGNPLLKNIGDTTYTVNVTDKGGLSAFQVVKITVKKKSMGVKIYQSGIPLKYNLSQNYPNPFNPTTTIRYNLPFESKVDFVVYNSLGVEIARIISRKQNAGFYQVDWKADSPSGIYFYTIKATEVGGNNSFTQTKKMMLLK